MGYPIFNKTVTSTTRVDCGVRVLRVLGGVTEISVLQGMSDCPLLAAKNVTGLARTGTLALAV